MSVGRLVEGVRIPIREALNVIPEEAGPGEGGERAPS